VVVVEVVVVEPRVVVLVPFVVVVPPLPPPLVLELDVVPPVVPVPFPFFLSSLQPTRVQATISDTTGIKPVKRVILGSSF
jgi:hypothetical protein